MRTGSRRPDLSRGDIRMHVRAIRERWPIPDDRRREIIDTLTFVACHPWICGARESVAAAKALLAADRINLEDEARALRGPEVIGVETRKPSIDFTRLSDEELERFIASGGL